MPRWSRSRASWAASSPLSSSADSSPSSPGGWPSARSSPASSASTSTSTWQRPDWGSWDLPGGHSQCPAAGPARVPCPRGVCLLPPCCCLGWFPCLHVPTRTCTWDTSAASSWHEGFCAAVPAWASPSPLPAALHHRACLCSRVGCCLHGEGGPPQWDLLLPAPSHRCWEEAQLLAGLALHGRDLGATSSLPSADFGVLLCVVCLSWLRASVFL